MCGIAGYFGCDPSPDALAAMVASLKHRGPDDDGIWLDEKHRLGLAHTRLSIIDLTASGHQPMWSADRQVVVVFNGEIYNFRKLRAELEEIGHVFFTHSDTEVLIMAYQVWGIKCLNRLEGMFAFALFDYHLDTLFLARDRFGEKPLYYFRQEDKLWFASEVRALLNGSPCKKELNHKVLREWLSYQTVHFPNTLVKDVFTLPPASYLSISPRTFELVQYWTANPKLHDASAPYIEDRLRSLFIQSVEQRLVSDAPLGAFLSGGIDSTILVGVASQLIAGFNTYTIAFDDSQFRDGYYAALAAKKFGTRHHEVKLRMTDVVEQVPQAVRAIDHPSADGVNTYIISKAVKTAGITVALSGLGGDELFGGYASFRQLSELPRWARRVEKIPRPLRRLAVRSWLAANPSIAMRKRLEFAGSRLGMAENYPLTRRYFFDDQVDQLVGTAGSQGEPRLEDDVVSGYYYTSVSRWEMQYYMHDVLLRDTDQMSMAHALEVRTPFLDSRLVEFVLGLPDSVKVNPSVNKFLFVKALREFIPDELVNRPKQGFSMPFDQWMRNELKPFCESRLSFLEEVGFFRPGAVTRVWRAFLKGHPAINWARIWLLVTLSDWLQANSIEV